MINLVPNLKVAPTAARFKKCDMLIAIVVKVSEV